jgi:YVTN family beta-propeller protein
MRRLFIHGLIISLLFLVSKNSYSQSPDQPESRRITLPNGWNLTPVGKLIPAGDLPLNMAISPSGKLAAVTNNGYGVQTIQLIDIENEQVIDSVEIGTSWLGLSFSADGKNLYASGGNDNIIIRYSVNKRKLVNTDTLVLGKPWPQKISIAGIASDEKNNRLYAVTKEDNSLYVIDLKSKRIITKKPLGGEGYTCILSPDRQKLYASCWGCDKVLVFNTSTFDITGSVNVGDNPNDMCLTADGKYLFVANSNDNNVSLIDTREQKVIETLNAALYPDSPSGSTTNSVALSKDENRLYVANADNNCLAVFDVSEPGRSKSLGFIPTGWYPTCVRTAGNKILVCNGKGISSSANPNGPNPARPEEKVIHHGGGITETKVQYIAGLFRGDVQVIQTPGEDLMGAYSKAVYNNTPYTREKEMNSEGSEGNPVPMKVGDLSPVKYVFYIIKENRTYDQVLGDMPEGNGDPDLVLFGENVTPNHHALAREFVLLDNFYVNGEVSADGHNWTMGAYATDFLEKNWPTNYSSRGGTYPGEGGMEIANNKNGFLWDACSRKGVSYRSYGEFITRAKANIPVLKDHFCKPFIGWDMSIRDTVRFRWWKEDFDSLLSINAVPRLNTIRFGNNHTEGLNLGRPTPFAHVADNDLATGMFVDYLSHSPIWKESLVIIVEDDAQNGPDHVDAHRSTAFLAGGYVKQGFVDHTPYTTTSLLRTIELILGLPPMTQYDAASVPLWRCMENSPSHPAYNARPANIDLNEKNTIRSQWQQLSETFDFTAEDKVNDFQFNEVLWRSVKGLQSPCPPAVRAAFFMAGNVEDED